MGCYLTLASCVKDEEYYIEDFVKIHKELGVERFLFLDRSPNKTKEIFKNDPSITVHHFPEGGGRVHHKAWLDVCNMMQGHTFWLAMIDCDEVLFPVNKKDLKEVLKDYETYPALGVNWNTFGSSGKDIKEPGSVYERLTKCAQTHAGINAHIQSIVQPLFVANQLPSDPHHMKLIKNSSYVNTKKQPFSGPFSNPIDHDILFCAHYITKSKEEFITKTNKGRADIYGEKMPMDLYDNHNSYCNEVEDLRISDFWKNIK